MSDTNTETDIHNFRGNSAAMSAMGRSLTNVAVSLPIAALAAAGSYAVDRSNIFEDPERSKVVSGILAGSAVASVVFPAMIGLAQGANQANQIREDHETLAQENQYLKGKLEGKTELTELMLEGRLVEPTEIVIEIGE